MIQEITTNIDGEIEILKWRAVAIKPYPNSEHGTFPLHNDDCPHGGEISCESRSGDSLCGGYFGHVGRAVIRCTETLK
jgi:hypothetical protein